MRGIGIANSCGNRGFQIKVGFFAGMVLENGKLFVTFAQDQRGLTLFNRQSTIIETISTIKL